MKGASIATTLAIVVLTQTSAVLAQVSTPVGGEAASASPSSKQTRLFHGFGLALLADVSESPNVVVGMNWNALVLGLGTNMRYRSQGSTASDAQQSDRGGLELGAVAAAQYMVYNRAPIAFGPELTFGTNLHPNRVFESNVLAAGIGFWYAPFNAPVLFGTAWNARISFQDNHSVTIALATPSLRLGFGLP